MNYQVDLLGAVNFSPESEVEEILQNIRTILSTRKGTVPLDRDFGVSWDHLDKPYPVARAQMQAAVIEAIEEFEPRAKVEEVIFGNDENLIVEGVLDVRVIVSIGEDEE